MIYILNGETINGQQFTKDGITYPSNWCEIVDEENRNSIGIITLEQIYPTINDTQEYDGTYIDDLTMKTRTYNVFDLPSNTLPTTSNQKDMDIQLLKNRQQEYVVKALLGDQTAINQIRSLQDQIDLLNV